MDKLVDRIRRRLRSRLGIEVPQSAPAIPEPLLQATCLDTFQQHVTGDRINKLEEDSELVFLSEGEPQHRKTHTLIISDIHLGSPVSRAKDLCRALRSWSFQRLIILGDLFDNTRFARLNKHHWKLLHELREIRRQSTGEVLWVAGNHDEVVLQPVARMLEAEVLGDDDFLRFTVGTRQYIAMHGHQFDRHVAEYPVRAHVAGTLYLLIQQADMMRDKRISRWVKQRSKELLKVAEEVAQQASCFAKTYGADTIVCGHVHLATQQVINGIQYINSGCWTETPATLVSIDESGAHLMEYH